MPKSVACQWIKLLTDTVWSATVPHKGNEVTTDHQISVVCLVTLHDEEQQQQQQLSPGKRLMLDEHGQQFFRGFLQVVFVYWSRLNSTCNILRTGFWVLERVNMGPQWFQTAERDWQTLLYADGQSQSLWEPSDRVHRSTLRTLV